MVAELYWIHCSHCICALGWRKTLYSLKKCVNFALHKTVAHGKVGCELIVLILSWKFLFRLYGEQSKKLVIVSCWLEIYILLRHFIFGSLFMTLIKLKNENKTKLCYITTSNVIKKERRSRGASSEVPSNNVSLQSSAVCQEKVMFPNQKPKPNLKVLSRAEKISTSIHR